MVRAFWERFHSSTPWATVVTVGSWRFLMASSVWVKARLYSRTSGGHSVTCEVLA